uniref:Uncharacterized protein n=1 Tax=Oryza barthii TaxID=65489 RepID=A0A0D3FZE9_9ORYZ
MAEEATAATWVASGEEVGFPGYGRGEVDMSGKNYDADRAAIADKAIALAEAHCDEPSRGRATAAPLVLRCREAKPTQSSLALSSSPRFRHDTIIS